MNVRLSVVILNYNGNPIVYDCLQGLFQSSYKDFELVFVDNNSSDGSLDECQRLIGDRKMVKIIKNTENVGFTAGFHIGVNASEGEYILMLNNDAVVYPNALEELIKFMDNNKNVGLAEGRIENIIGSEYDFSDPKIAFFLGWITEAGPHVHNPNKFSTINRIFAPVGVWPIIRKDVYNKIGGYDLDFIHVEEIRDLSARVWIYGYEVGYVYSAVTKHVGRLTTVNLTYGSNISRNLYYHATKNQLMLYFKNFSGITVFKYYLPYFILKFFDLNYTLIKLGKQAFFLKVNAYVWVIKNFPNIMNKRKLIQEKRVVSDKVMFKNLVKVNIKELQNLITVRTKYDLKTEKWIKK